MLGRIRQLGRALGAAALMASPPALAHESPGDVIHALNHRMAQEGPTARLLHARAWEYQALGQWEAAAEDFEAALALQPRFVDAARGLAAAHLEQGDGVAAEAAARLAIRLLPDPANRAPAEALLARALAAQTRWPEAAEAWHRALAAPNPEVDWFLGEAASLGAQGLHEARVRALDAARKRNPSVVLHRAWVRALVDAGDLETASIEIERGLAAARWQSAWLLLRARVHGRRGDIARQQADAARALEELGARIHPDRPDGWLVAEYGIGLALQGDADGARACEKQARDLGVPVADLREIDQLLEAAPTAP